MATIQGVYIALFGRPADPLGLAFFNEATSNGADLTAIGDLAATAEYQSRFEGQTDIQIVNSIYRSLFDRDPDVAGLTFFANALQTGAQTINTIAINIYDGAQGPDLAILANKEAAANLFTASLDTGAEIAAYQGDQAAALGRAFLASITGDPATVPTQAQIDAAIQAIVDGFGSPGQFFNLTNAANGVTGGIDIITGTVGDDTFRAILPESLGSADILDGGAGYDVLEIALNGADGDIAPTIRNIERINNADAFQFNLANVTGVQQIWSSFAHAYVNADLGTVFGADMVNGDAEIGIEYAGSGRNVIARLAVDAIHADDEAFFYFGQSSDDVIAVNVLALSRGTIWLHPDLDELETIAVTGEGSLIFSNAGRPSLVTFDAGANSGGVQASLAAGTGLESVLGGSGNDVFTIDPKASGVQITLGAGSDLINIGGPGPDETNAIANITTIDRRAFLDDVITITDFNVAEDFLSINGQFGRNVLTNTQLAAIAAEETLYDAINAAAPFADGIAVVVFNFAGNAYIFSNTENQYTGSFSPGDGLVELRGVSVSQLNATNFEVI